jgi:hypothetical protein
MARIIYTYEQALIKSKEGHPIYLNDKNEFFLLDYDELLMEHPHDSFFSKELTYVQEIDAIAQQKKLTN